MNKVYTMYINVQSKHNSYLVFLATQIWVKKTVLQVPVIFQIYDCKLLCEGLQRLGVLTESDFSFHLRRRCVARKNCLGFPLRDICRPNRLGWNELKIYSNFTIELMSIRSTNVAQWKLENGKFYFEEISKYVDQKEILTICRVSQSSY